MGGGGDEFFPSTHGTEGHTAGTGNTSGILVRRSGWEKKACSGAKQAAPWGKKMLDGHYYCVIIAVGS